MKTNIIENCNCLEGMKKLPDNSIDLIVSDIPYKIIAGGISIKKRKDDVNGIFKKRIISDGTKCSNKWLKKNNKMICAVKDGKMFEHNNIQFHEWLPECYRILKKGTHCYFMVNGRNLKKLQTEAEKVGFIFQNLLVWNKGNLTPNKYYMNGCEFILMLSKRPARNINDMGQSNMISIPNIIGNKLHPTQKPVELMEVFVSQSSDEGDVILDMFAGSFSSLIAAKNLKRNFIGYEIDKEYFDIGKKRLKEETPHEFFG